MPNYKHKSPATPLANRERQFHQGQNGENIAQILSTIAFSLDEEDDLTIVDVTSRVRAAFDVEKVTKKFYDHFKKQHDAFLKFIEGIPDVDFQRWYASVMINRIMFIYFVQKKGFLADDNDYLRNRLAQTKGNFYRDFLCLLFFEGFAKKDHAPDIRRLLGDVPYLNGGLFLPHQVEERYGEAIQIEDEAFEKLFDFFDEYQWHLDERPLRNDNEINPDVLGYIFEKYINQKQMGAYYTKEDITEYISKNTVIPYLFDEARKAVKIAFEGEHTVWDLLAENPDRYIYSAVRHGTELDLPKNIAIGVDDVSQRGDWNTPAPSEFGLPTEIWRETVARRQRYFDIRKQMENGEVKQINDLITLNLDIQQFAQDVIDYSDSSDLIRAFWKAINGVTVLDPTCGSGAFLFAALNILDPLYDACLERMADLVDDLPADAHPQKLSDFKLALERMNQHPNRRYFILKSIIINNLFGVDIMEEAVEICKLRLFLKLVAQIDDKERIEPLPDIDFNIRAGNTLVGFATQEQLKQAITNPTGDAPKLMILPEEQEALEVITQKAEVVDCLFGLFRQQQTELDHEVLPEDKANLRQKLTELADELNKLLAVTYGINTAKEKEYAKWLKSHTPFHWFTEFYGVIKDGGFDVIVGNPPYVNYNKVKKQYSIFNYSTKDCSDLYAFTIERCTTIRNAASYIGMIIPNSAFCTKRMTPLIYLMTKNSALWISNFAIRPAKLFVGVDQRLSILIYKSSNTQILNSTEYYRWNERKRDHLFKIVNYQEIDNKLQNSAISKVGSTIEKTILQKLTSASKTVQNYFGIETTAYYHNAPRYWIRAMNFVPYFWNEQEGEKISSHTKSLKFSSSEYAEIITALLNSSLFYWWFILHSNCRDLTKREIDNFPIDIATISSTQRKQLSELTTDLMDDLRSHANRKVANYKATGRVEYDEFFPRYSKDIIDKIDIVLGHIYGLSETEVDYIINFSVNFRTDDEE